MFTRLTGLSLQESLFSIWAVRNLLKCIDELFVLTPQRYSDPQLSYILSKLSNTCEDQQINIPSTFLTFNVEIVVCCEFIHDFKAPQGFP